MHLQCCFLLQVVWGFSFQIYDAKNLTKLVKFILEKHIYPNFCLNIFERLQKCLGKRFTGCFMISSLQGPWKREKRWLGRLEPERKTDNQELFWKFYSSDGQMKFCFCGWDKATKMDSKLPASRAPPR